MTKKLRNITKSLKWCQDEHIILFSYMREEMLSGEIFYLEDEPDGIFATQIAGGDGAWLPKHWGFA